MPSIVPVVLAGGSGTRLWPISRPDAPKQFMDLGGDGSLFQDAVRRGMAASDQRAPIVVTSVHHRTRVERDLRERGVKDYQLVLEPVARNTAAAIYAASKLLGADDLMLVLSADQWIPDTQAFAQFVGRAARTLGSELATLSIRPRFAATQYGYVELGEALDRGIGYRVLRFVEKPDLETASRYFKSGRFLWNSGIFLFPVASYQKQVAELMAETRSAVDKAVAAAKVEGAVRTLDATAMLAAPNVSVDFGIMEHCRSVTYPYDGDWSDLGTWDAVQEFMAKRSGQPNATRGDVKLYNVRDSLIMGGRRLVVVSDLDHVAVIDTPDALYVGSLETRKSDDGGSASGSLKRIVESLAGEKRPEVTTSTHDVRPWGEFETLYRSSECHVKRIMVEPGQRLSLQSHERRTETWTVVAGIADVTVNDTVTRVSATQSITIPCGARHRVYNPGTERLIFIEVQTGSYFGEDDIKRYQDDYGRS